MLRKCKQIVLYSEPEEGRKTAIIQSLLRVLQTFKVHYIPRIKLKGYSNFIYDMWVVQTKNQTENVAENAIRMKIAVVNIIMIETSSVIWLKHFYNIIHRYNFSDT